MANIANIRGVKTILLELQRRSERMIMASDPTAMAAQEFQVLYRPFYNRDQLERLLPKVDGDQGGFDDQYIYLEPPDRLGPESVVLLDGEWRLGARDEFRLRLGIFVPKGNHGDGYGFVGYRFETPEGLGDHDYWHIQPINAFGVAVEPLPEAVPWIPTRLPAVPLDARNIVQLLAVVLIGLNGLSGKEDLIAMLAGEPARKLVDEVANVNQP